MYISMYISSATFAWSSILTVDIDSMGPGLQLLGGQFLNFLLGKVSLEFKLHGMSIFHNIQMATYFDTGWCYSYMVGYAGSPTYCVCWCDLDPIQGQGQGHGAFELPTTSEAVHAGGDDCSPLVGLSDLLLQFIFCICLCIHISETFIPFLSLSKSQLLTMLFINCFSVHVNASCK